MSQQLSDLKSAVADLQSSVTALVAQDKAKDAPADLQPVTDQVKAIKSQVDAALPPPPPAPAPVAPPV